LKEVSDVCINKIIQIANSKIEIASSKSNKKLAVFEKKLNMSYGCTSKFQDLAALLDKGYLPKRIWIEDSEDS
jgi:hypothetical protein